MPESFLYFETFFVELEEIVRDLCGKIVKKELYGLFRNYYFVFFYLIYRIYKRFCKRYEGMRR
jgi:hypothetical protein